MSSIQELHNRLYTGSPPLSEEILPITRGENGFVTWQGHIYTKLYTTAISEEVDEKAQQNLPLALVATLLALITYSAYQTIRLTSLQGRVHQLQIELAQAKGGDASQLSRTLSDARKILDAELFRNYAINCAIFCVMTWIATTIYERLWHKSRTTQLTGTACSWGGLGSTVGSTLSGSTEDDRKRACRALDPHNT